MKSRDKSVDMLRGICILCVMMGHVGYIPDMVMRWLLPFYVPAFFFITGYLKHDLPKNACSRRIYRRWRRLIVPYFFYSVLLLFLCTIIHHMKSKEIIFAIKGILYSRFCLYSDIQNINNIFFFKVANSPLWFLTASFVCEVVFECTFYGVKNNWEMIIRCIFLLIMGMFMEQLKILLPWSIDIAVTGAALMAAGFYWKVVEPKCSKKCTYYLLFLVYVVVAALNVNTNMSVRYYGPYLLSIFLFFIGGIAGAILVKRICDIAVKFGKMNIIQKLFCLIGENSMTIFTLHWFIFLFLDIIIEKCKISVFWPLGWSILKIVQTLIICICIEKGGCVVKKKVEYFQN